MADNYLENQMEKYRSGKLGTGKTKTVVRSRREGELTLRYPKLRIFLAYGLTETGQAMVKAFRAIDAKVAFAGEDKKRGTELARASGSRFIPSDVVTALRNAREAWDGLDIIIMESPENVNADVIPSEGEKLVLIGNGQNDVNTAGAIVVEPGNMSAEAIARLVRFVCQPENGLLTAGRIQIRPSSE